MHLQRYTNYLRWIEFFQLLGNMLGVYIAMQVLIVNTGDFPDLEHKHWYSDSNSLSTTFILTFIFPLILIFISYFL